MRFEQLKIDYQIDTVNELIADLQRILENPIEDSLTRDPRSNVINLKHLLEKRSSL